jgi:adenine-specific DNA-methyltransferase
MSFDKLDLQSPNFTNVNIQKLADLFPHCVTETDSGKAIDFDLLKQELLPDVVEGNKERYRLEWPGKREAIVTANLPTNKTLRPIKEDSVDFDTTENLYIEGDNLEVLKLLQESYLGKIKMIYFDPPYNTGKDFVYKDNFTQNSEEYKQESGQVDENKLRLFQNPETSGRYHSDWLSMMYPRLKLARNLLTDDGVVFISIDDNEVHNLRKMCDEIFGEGNFISSFIITRSEGGGLAKNAIIGHDYLLIYSKNYTYFKPLMRPKDIRGEVVTIDNEDYWIEEDWLRKEFGKYGTCPYGEIEFYYNKEKKEEIDRGISKGHYKLINKNGVQIVGRLRKISEDGSKFYTIQKHLNKNGIQDLKLLNLNSIFPFPKPITLIKSLTLGATFSLIDKNSIILDFFSGSATTAHAVLQLNAEDGGKRKFIMVQIPELTDEKSEAYKAGYKNICEIGKERIRRAGKKIKEGIVDSPNVEEEEDSEEEDSEKLDFSQVGGVSRASTTGVRSSQQPTANSQQPTANSQFSYYKFRCQAKFSCGLGYWVSCITTRFQQSSGCVLQTTGV